MKVWNDFDEDIPFPVAFSGAPVSSLAMAKGKVEERGGEGCSALVIVSDNIDGGAVTVKPDVAVLGLKDGYGAYDFETGAELPLKDGAATMTLKKHDFAIVEFK